MTPTPEQAELPDWMKERFREGWDDPSNLLPELQPYVEKREDGAIMLRHPLVYQVWSFNAWEANEIFNGKTKYLQEKQKAEDWGNVVFAYERPYRPDILLHVWDWTRDLKILRELLPDVYRDAEYPYQSRAKLLKLFRLAHEPGYVLGDDGEQHDLSSDVADEIPPVLKKPELVVYRGTKLTEPVGKLGLSWTLSRKVAHWFARRYEKTDAVVYMARIEPRNVFAHLIGRGENEIVADPKHLVNLRPIFRRGRFV